MLWWLLLLDCCCNTGIAEECNEAKNSLTPGQNNIISPLSVTAPEQIGVIVSLCHEHVLSLALSRQMLIGLINLSYYGQDVLKIIFL